MPIEYPKLGDVYLEVRSAGGPKYIYYIQKVTTPSDDDGYNIILTEGIAIGLTSNDAEYMVRAQRSNYPINEWELPGYDFKVDRLFEKRSRSSYIHYEYRKIEIEKEILEYLLLFNEFPPVEMYLDKGVYRIKK